MHLSKFLAVAAVVGAWSHEADSASETSVLLQATTAILVDSDAELEVDSEKSSSMLIHDRARTQKTSAHGTKTGTGTKTAHLLKLRKLNKTVADVHCLAASNAKCWNKLSAVTSTLSTCLQTAGQSNLLLLQAVKLMLPQTVAEWAANAATQWQQTSTNLNTEADEMQQLSESDNLDAEVAILSLLISQLGGQAAEDETLLHEAYEECRAAKVTELTGVCAPFDNLYKQMEGHHAQAGQDLLLLQQLHDRVKTHPELALIEGKHVTSITEGDKLSTEAISTLRNLLNHQQTVMDQISAECQSLAPNIQAVLNAVPSSLECVNRDATQAAIDVIAQAGQGC